MMDLLDYGRTGQVEQVIETFEIFVPVFEALTAKRCFVESIALDHGPHSAVEDNDALPQNSA